MRVGPRLLPPHLLRLRLRLRLLWQRLRLGRTLQLHLLLLLLRRRRLCGSSTCDILGLDRCNLCILEDLRRERKGVGGHLLRRR